MTDSNVMESQFDRDSLSEIIEEWAERYDIEVFRSEVQDLARTVLRSEWMQGCVGSSGARELLTG